MVLHQILFERLDDPERCEEWPLCARSSPCLVASAQRPLILSFMPDDNYNINSVLYNEIFAYHKETSEKAEIANQVVNKIYNSFKQWFFTITFCDFTYIENRILKYTETQDYGYPVLLLNGCPHTNTTKVKPRINKHGQTAYVITSKELTLDVSEYIIETLVRTGVFKPRSAVIFIINVPVEMDSYYYYVMKNHFQFLWTRSVTNSVVILWSDRLYMFSYNPFSDQLKEINDVKNVGGFLSKQYYNLYGHELRLSVFRKKFITDKTGPVKCDSKLATMVMNRLNASCKPITPRDGNTVGDLLDDGTATGVTGDLIDGYTDLELNSRILKNSYYGYIDTTYPLTQDELCFLVKKSEKQSTFMTTLKLNHQTTGTTVMLLIKCFIRQTADIKFMGSIFRFLTLMTIMYSLIIDCVIDGIITSAVTYPRHKHEISTLQDVTESNLTLGIHNRHIRSFNKSLSTEYNLLHNRIEVFDDNKFKIAIDKKQYQYALLLRRTDLFYISRKPENMHNGRPLFHTVEECPLRCSIVYGLRYGSPYLPRINMILMRLYQAGILQYWSKSDELTLNQNLHDNTYKEQKPLKLKNLKEMFYV
ncbi:ionotropic receptor 85a [Aphomia sociella]